jgi:hypothetical protein
VLKSHRFTFVYWFLCHGFVTHLLLLAACTIGFLG